MLKIMNYLLEDDTLPNISEMYPSWGYVYIIYCKNDETNEKLFCTYNIRKY